MPSQLDEARPSATRERRLADVFLVWNRRIHYYLGLYLLFFTWLFTFTGLLLNHGDWKFAEFWPNRVQGQTEQTVAPVSGTSELEQARDLMRQLGMAGELQWPAAQPLGGLFTFQVSRPGLILDVKADLRTGHATVQRNELNAWGVMRLLHTFTGVRAADPANSRDWLLTTVWAISMDAVAAGLIVMVFSSYIMWYRLKAKRGWGILALLAGCALCVVLIAGLPVFL